LLWIIPMIILLKKPCLNNMLMCHGIIKIFLWGFWTYGTYCIKQIDCFLSFIIIYLCFFYTVNDIDSLADNIITHFKLVRGRDRCHAVVAAAAAAVVVVVVYVLCAFFLSTFQYLYIYIYIILYETSSPHVIH